MDQFSLSFYRLRFQNKFLTERGDAFQALFSEIMSRGYPSAFIATRPWGSHGDRKNDGYRSDIRCLYQLYAPNELEARKAIEKMEEDFADALPHWRKYFDTWCFVHNSYQGLGPDVLKCLLGLGTTDDGPRTAHMGYHALEDEFMKLEERHMEAICGGVAPNTANLNSLRSSDFVGVIRHLAEAEVEEVDIKPVSASKITRNELSDHAINYLQSARLKTDQVERLFNGLPDPESGERIAQTFRNKYESLKSEGYTGDAILSKLIAFCGSSPGGMHEQVFQAGVAVLIAYLFERCDIFEDWEDQTKNGPS